MNNENMWYNGCYTMTSYVQNNEKVFTKNPLYWDTECKLFDTVNVRLVESNDIAFQLYQSGELDEVLLTESNLKTISSNENNEYYNYLVEKPADKYSYQIHFNFDKYNEDGTKDDRNRERSIPSVLVLWSEPVRVLQEIQHHQSNEL